MNTERQKKLYTFALASIIFFAAVYLVVNIPVVSDFFSGIKKVFSPIIIGAAIAYMLNPILKLYEYKILRKLKNKRLRRTLSLIFTYLTVVLFIVAFFLLIIPQLIDSLKNLTSEFDTYVEKTINMINTVINKFSKNPQSVAYFDKETFFAYLMKIFNTSGDLFNSILSYLSQISSGLFTAIKDAILGIFISIYMLTSKEHLHAQARRITAALFKEKNRNHILRYTRIANRTFGNFFVGIIIDAILITIVTFVALTIFRVPYAILVSVIVGCTNIIPVFGPFIGAIPSAFIIFVKEPSKALVFIILILIIQQIEGNIIAPKILGNSTGVSPLGVIVAIILMGAYLGVIGMIIGVPIFAMILTVCNEIIETRLKANGLPTDTAEYYPAYSLVDPNERHEKLINRIFDTTKNICLKIIKIFKKKSKKVNPDTEKETQNNDERSE